MTIIGVLIALLLIFAFVVIAKAIAPDYGGAIQVVGLIFVVIVLLEFLATGGLPYLTHTCRC